MASLAGMLKARGIHVTGSDTAAYPPMSDSLAKLGITSLSHSRTRISLLVLTSSSSAMPSHAEISNSNTCSIIAFLRTSMAALLHEEFFDDRETIVVAGTHGKTTTTSMLAWIFNFAERKPNFLIGGIAENFGTSFAVTTGREFILEGDEYDTAFFDKGPKFMHYFPDSVILTSVEFDHADIYKGLDEVKTAFKRLVNLIPKRGRLIAWDASGNVNDCVRGAFCKVERYGLNIVTLADHRHELRVRQDELVIVARRQAMGSLHLPARRRIQRVERDGRRRYGLSLRNQSGTITEALETFKSVKRRLEVKAEVKGVTIIDDFAHHPTAISETLRALRSRYKGRRLWAVLEPRSNTLRRNIFQKDLVNSLAIAGRSCASQDFQSEVPFLKPSVSTSTPSSPS